MDLPNHLDMPELPDTLTDRVAFALQLALVRAQAMGEAALTGLGRPEPLPAAERRALRAALERLA